MTTYRVESKRHPRERRWAVMGTFDNRSAAEAYAEMLRRGNVRVVRIVTVD